MSPVTHFLAGWMVAQGATNPRDRALIAIAGVAPDLDGLGIIPELLTRNSTHPLPWFSEYHHVAGHNIGFAIAFSLLVVLLARHRLLTGMLAFLSLHLHFVCDVTGARGPDGYQWPIPYLLPFSHRWDIAWTGQWALNAWPNFLLTFLLLGATGWLAVKRGFSPLEMISLKADQSLVATLRKRFSRARTAHA